MILSDLFVLSVCVHIPKTCCYKNLVFVIRFLIDKYEGKVQGVG